MGAHEPPAKAALRLIFFILLMDVIGLSMLFPIAPFLVRRYSDDALMVTMLTVIYAAAQFFGAPALGKLGDHYGRRPVLLLSLFGSIVGYVVLGLGGALWVLFVSRLIGGLAAGNQSTAAAYIADISAPEERAKNFTLIGMAWGLGLILGPALGAGLGRISLDAPAYAGAALALLSLLLGIVLLPELLPGEQHATTPLHMADLNPFGSIFALARRPGMRQPLLVLCLFNVAFNGMNSTETLFAIERYAAQPAHVGFLMALVGVAIAVVQAALVPRLVPRYGERHIAIVCLAGQAFAGLASAAAPSFWLLASTVVLRHAASSFVFPTLAALTANRVSPREQGALMGVTTALTSLMSIFGPLWAGLAYERVMPGAPYWIGAGVLVLAALALMPTPSPRSARRST